MLSAQTRKEKYQAYQAVFRNRAKNLRKIIERTPGTWHSVAKQTGKSIQLLKQCAGDNPCRSIGDKLTTELEWTLRLLPGTLSLPWNP